MMFLGLPLPVVVALAVLGTALVVLLHWRRRAPQSAVVSSLLLWHRLLTQEAEKRYRSGRGSGALWLAIAVVLLLSAASGDPVWSPPPAPQTTLVLLDSSRTMATLEGSETRLVLAKAEVEQRLLGSPETRLMLVALAPTPEPLGPMLEPGSDATAVLESLAKLQAGPRPLDTAALRRFLSAVVPELKPNRILLFSDGVSWLKDMEPPAIEGIALEQLTVGSKVPNVALTSLGARRSPADRDRATVRAEVANSGDREVALQVTLLDDTRAVHSAELRIPAQGTALLEASDVLCLSGRLTARLEAPRAVNALPVDDVAYAAVPPRRALRVLLVSAGNVFLQAALQADSRVQLRQVTLAEFESEPSAREADLVVLDGVVPSTAPAQPRLYIHPQGTPPEAPFQVLGRLSRPIFERVSARDPLTANLSLSDVNIAEALKVRPGPGDVVAAAAPGGPLLVRGERSGQRIAALTMRLSETDLPLRTAFPVLVRNAIDWLLASEGTYQDPLPMADDLALPAGARGPLRSPDDAPQSLLQSSTGLRFTPHVPGFYEFQETRVPIAVTPAVPETVSIAPQTVWSEAAEAPAPRSPRPAPWQGLALLALLLMALEFWRTRRREVNP